MAYYAKVIADSISRQGIRLTSMEVSFPWLILQEFTRHRVFSPSFRSSRAVPVERLLEEVRNDPCMPVWWGKNQKGMEAAEELGDDPDDPSSGIIGLSPKESAKTYWKDAANDAARWAEIMASYGLHKQIANRVLAPFTWAVGIVTATEWDNFFGLRLHRAAQPEFRRLAELMWAARSASKPRAIGVGQWHMPYVGEEDMESVIAHCAGADCLPVIQKMSVARCARVSYRVHDADRAPTLAEDLALHDRLTRGLTDPDEPLHASPMEHQATPDEPGWPRTFTFPAELTEAQRAARELPMSVEAPWGHGEQHGNFRGWRQYRKMLPGEACAPLPEGYR